jgi:hypothetical protein
MLSQYGGGEMGCSFWKINPQSKITTILVVLKNIYVMNPHLKTSSGLPPPLYEDAAGDLSKARGIDPLLRRGEMANRLRQLRGCFGEWLTM